MNALERYLLGKIEEINKMDSHEDLSLLESLMKHKKAEMLDYMEKHQDLPEIKKLSEDFQNYISVTEKFIIARRLESGISTLLYFVYSMMGNFAGIAMSLLVLITTTGSIGHIILIVSIIGSALGIMLALNSMKMERKFMLSLKNSL
ncbi:MAG: hypothetical protein ACP5NC_05055 [Nitrososphaeria archaeon]